MNSFDNRQRLEDVKEELLLAGTSSSLSMPLPPSIPSRASDRQTRGQKKASDRLRGQVQQPHGSRLGLLMERKKIRNYNILDDDRRKG